MYKKNYYRALSDTNELFYGYLVYLENKFPTLVTVFEVEKSKNPHILKLNFENVEEKTLCRFICFDKKGAPVFEKDYLKVYNFKQLYFIESYEKYIEDNRDVLSFGYYDPTNIEVVGNILMPIKNIQNI